MPAQEKVEAMEAENIQLRQQITDLTIKTNNKETYLTEMDKMLKEIDPIVKPVDFLFRLRRRRIVRPI